MSFCEEIGATHWVLEELQRIPSNRVCWRALGTRDASKRTFQFDKLGARKGTIIAASAQSARILIVGAGIAGTALAAYLTRGGVPATVGDRVPPFGPEGYMLGLLPVGGDTLRELGLLDRYLAGSCEVRRYEAFDRNGRQLKTVALERLNALPGSYRGIERGALLDLLRSAAEASQFLWNRGLSAIEEHDDHVNVSFEDGSTGAYDLVIGADGMHSTVRRLIFGEQCDATYRTGWGGWVVWIPELIPDDDSYRELWSVGWGIGLYPVAGRVGVFLAGNIDQMCDQTPSEVARRVERTLPEGPFKRALGYADFSGTPYFWKMEDHRSDSWHTDRIVLLGDAATGFLPTAGIGASIAMESAGILAPLIMNSDPTSFADALSEFEARQRHRAERAQRASRTLARVMFLNSPISAFLRDQAMRIYPRKWLADGILNMMTRSAVT